VNPQAKVCGMAAGPRTERSPSQTETRSNRMTPLGGPSKKTPWASQLARVIVCAVLLLALAAPAAAQRRKRTAQRKESRPAPAAATAKKSAPEKSKGKKEQRFDFTGFELAGSVRMPQLLYFLDRAEEELERASLERRTFVPEMLKSIDEENL
jgi:hypothetical protein